MQKRQERYFVNKYEEGNYEQQEVEVGIFGDEGFVQILSGLTEGDIIVLQ